MADKPEPFIVPQPKSVVGFKPNDQDRKNLRLLMADRRETSFSNLLRELVATEAAYTRKRWTIAAKRIAAKEENGG